MNKQVAKLVLSTYGFVANSTNSIGYMDTYAQSFTWNNINLRTLLGDMWDKYELFNLSLVEMAAGVSVFNFVNDNLNVAINISGLSFSNCNYDTNQK
jgi:type IV secretory pathway VirB6-like protein